MNDLLTVYGSYLQCLNERQWERLGEFVAERLSYNGRQLTLADYRELLEADARAIPDLGYDAELLLANDHVVSCRLVFECTPRHAFLGFEPTGRRISFAEHVFYRFEDRKIVDVWSLIDTAAIRDQLSR